MENSTNDRCEESIERSRALGFTNTIFAFGDYAGPGAQLEVSKIKNLGCISYFFIEFENETPMAVVKLLKSEACEYVALTPEADKTEGDRVAPITIFKWSRPTAMLTVLSDEEFTAIVPRFLD